MAPAATPKKLYKPAQAAMPTAGKNYLIYLNVGTDSIDASHKGSGGWKSTIAGLKEWSIDLETLLMPNEESLTLLEKAFLDGEYVHLKFEYPDKSYMTGIASVTELSLNTPHDDVATYKGSLNGVGPLSELKKA